MNSYRAIVCVTCFWARFRKAALCVVLTALAAGTASAAVIFSDNFNSGGLAQSGTHTQYQTGLKIGYSQNTTGWTKAGDGAIHCVDRTGAGNWAIMFYGGNNLSGTNTITLSTGIAANSNGVSYIISGSIGGAVYTDPTQINQAGDFLTIDLLRTDGTTVVSSTNIYPAAAWRGALNMTPFSFIYTGNGNDGNLIKLRVKPRAVAGRFHGSLDDLTVDFATSTINAAITAFTATSPTAPGTPITFNWTVIGMPLDTLVLNPGNIDVKSLTDGGTGVGSYILASGPTKPTTYTLTATRATSSAQASANVLMPNTAFFESFTGITGLTVNGGSYGQMTTTHDLGFSGNLAGWSKAGDGTLHAVDTANTVGQVTPYTVTSNPRNWGVMLWENNVITQSDGITDSNDSGKKYAIDFLAAGAVYNDAAGVQMNNGTTDGIKIEILRASNSAVLHTFTKVPAQPIGVGNLGLTPVHFTYYGDGSGDILFRIGPVNANQGRFQGTIDDLILSWTLQGTLIILY